MSVDSLNRLFIEAQVEIDRIERNKNKRIFKETMEEEEKGIWEKKLDKY